MDEGEMGRRRWTRIVVAAGCTVVVVDDALQCLQCCSVRWVVDSWLVAAAAAAAGGRVAMRWLKPYAGLEW